MYIKIFLHSGHFERFALAIFAAIPSVTLDWLYSLAILKENKTYFQHQRMWRFTEIRCVRYRRWFQTQLSIARFRIISEHYRGSQFTIVQNLTRNESAELDLFRSTILVQQASVFHVPNFTLKLETAKERQLNMAELGEKQVFFK